MTMAHAKGKRDAAAALRAAQAADLKASGMTYDQIAQIVGYSDKASCYRAVQRELERHTCESIEHYRNEELAIIDKLMEAVWPLVIFEAGATEEKDGKIVKKKPSLFAIDRILMLRERRAKLLGLDAKGEQAVSAQVIIREYGVNVEGV